MTDFFHSITSFFEMIWDIVVNAVQSIVFLVEMIITSTSFNQELMIILPPFLSVCVISFTVIAVCKLLIGR